MLKLFFSLQMQNAYDLFSTITHTLKISAKQNFSLINWRRKTLWKITVISYSLRQISQGVQTERSCGKFFIFQQFLKKGVKCTKYFSLLENIPYLKPFTFCISSDLRIFELTTKVKDLHSLPSRFHSLCKIHFKYVFLLQSLLVNCFISF